MHRHQQLVRYIVLTSCQSNQVILYGQNLPNFVALHDGFPCRFLEHGHVLDRLFAGKPYGSPLALKITQLVDYRQNDFTESPTYSET
jgi:hypothetical protein